MTAASVYRISFLLLFAFFWIVRIYYVRKTRDPIIFAIFGIPLRYVRMRNEERTMIEQFGSEYEEYIERTGRIFPKL
jgi:protein-S-isoprenylcysteine O-methyltransferase Ste14